jgi:protein-tyrosine phosphatase
MIRVLFVCTGNICRSPTAEGVFRHLVTAAGLENAFDIASAGTDSYHVGEAPDARAIKVARENGVDISYQRAQQVQTEDFENFEYIFAMDNGHLQELQRRAPPGSLAHITLFLDAVDGAESDVPDPWYGSEEDFHRVYVMVDKGARAILEKIRGTFAL